MTVIVTIIQIIKIFLENQTLSRWTELDDFRKAKKNLLQPPSGCGYQASEDLFFFFLKVCILHVYTSHKLNTGGSNKTGINNKNIVQAELYS